MSQSERKRHWDAVYRGRSVETVTWYQAVPRLSLELIERSGIAHDAALIDVGGGTSVLADLLLERGYRDLTVLDVSAEALRLDRERLGAEAARIEFIEADITEFRPSRLYALWHDRAVFHFLSSADQRKRYVAVMREALAADGTAIIATFAPDGPRRCSGLDVVRYDAEKLLRELGTGFRLEEELRESHRTPAGGEQRFAFFRLSRDSG